MYIQVNIGRNIGSEPMPLEKWEQFIDTTKHAIWSASIGSIPDNDDIEVHLGTGSWNKIYEDSAQISLYHPDGFNLETLKGLCKVLEELYSQEKVVLITA